MKRLFFVQVQQGIGVAGQEGRRKDGPYQIRGGGGAERDDVLKQLRAGFQNALGDVLNSVGHDGRPDGPLSARGSPSHEVLLTLRVYAFFHEETHRTFAAWCQSRPRFR